jgi:serpin B
MPPGPQLDLDGPIVSRRALLLGIAAATAAAPLAACAGSPPVPQLLVAEGVARAQPAPDAPTDDVRAAMTAFAHRMITSRAATGQNTIVSPLSIACVFAMARVGAGGTTAAQLDQVFGFPRQGRDAAFNAITRELATTDGPPPKIAKWKPGTPAPKPVVSLGNALFTAKALHVGEPFLRVLAADYGTGARPVDYRSGDATAQIDAWVRQQTAGRITKLFDRLDPSTLLVLANAIYFKGYWASPFVPHGAVDQPFTCCSCSPRPAAVPPTLSTPPRSTRSPRR